MVDHLMTYITNKDWFYEVATNRVSGKNAFLLLAETFSVATGATPGGVSPDSGGLFDGFPDNPTLLRIQSDSSDDDVLGTGARTLFIEGLDANYDIISEVLDLDGLLPVESAKQYLRLRRVKVATAGSQGWNAGTIIIEDSGQTEYFGAIEPYVSTMRNGRYTVPAGRTAKVQLVSLNAARESGGVTGLVDIIGYSRENYENAPWIRTFESRLDTAQAQDLQINAALGDVLSEETDVRLTYLADRANVRLNVRTSIIEEIL